MIENIIYSMILTLESALVYFFMKNIYKNKKINKYMNDTKCNDKYSEEYTIRYHKYLDIKCILVTITNIIIALSVKTSNIVVTFILAVISILIIDNIYKHHDISEDIK